MKKLVNLFSVLLMISAMSVSFVSCGSDGDSGGGVDPTPIVEDKFKNTSWIQKDTYSDGSSDQIRLDFYSTTAKLTVSAKEGSQTLTTEYNFTYRSSENIAILTAQDQGIVNMEAKIESDIKLTLRNASTGAEIAVLYKN